jgi:IS30 family transposase
MQISHETIYRSLFIQTRGVLKKELMVHLRTARQMRRAKGGTRKSGLGQIIDTVSIRERPTEAEDRAVPGPGRVQRQEQQTIPRPRPVCLLL